MKKYPKKLLDNLIETSRAYWNGEADSNFEQRNRLSEKMKASFALAKAIGVDWLSIQNFVDGIVATRGIYPDAENDEIYCALRCLGWEPIDK